MQCNFFKEDGLRCSAAALKEGDGFCFTHEPEAKQAHREASIKGGSASKCNDLNLPPLSLKSTQDVIILLEDTINALRSGDIKEKTATTVGYLANILLGAFEKSNLENRLEAVENLIGEHKLKTIKYD